MSVVYNEQTKLTANWFNLISAGTTALAIFMLAIGEKKAFSISVVMVLLGVIFHFLGRWTLTRLKSDV